MDSMDRPGVALEDDSDSNKKIDAYMDLLARGQIDLLEMLTGCSKNLPKITEFDLSQLDEDLPPAAPIEGFTLMVPEEEPLHSGAEYEAYVNSVLKEIESRRRKSRSLKREPRRPVKKETRPLQKESNKTVKKCLLNCESQATVISTNCKEALFCVTCLEKKLNRKCRYIFCPLCGKPMGDLLPLEL